jgi:hypothetical protein
MAGCPAVWHPRTARRGRTSARPAGFPAPPASRSHLRMMPVSNGKSILTGPAGRRQGSAGIHFRFFHRPHFIHRRRLVIRMTRHLSTGLYTTNPQVPWITIKWHAYPQMAQCRIACWSRGPRRRDPGTGSGHSGTTDTRPYCMVAAAIHVRTRRRITCRLDVREGLAGIASPGDRSALPRGGGHPRQSRQPRRNWPRRPGRSLSVVAPLMGGLASRNHGRRNSCDT